jgi:hypothetical protein
VKRFTRFVIFRVLYLDPSRPLPPVPNRSGPLSQRDRHHDGSHGPTDRRQQGLQNVIQAAFDVRIYRKRKTPSANDVVLQWANPTERCWAISGTR